MSPYGLKTNIAVNMALLLFFGMALTAFLTTNLFQRLLVKSEIDKGRLLISAIENETFRLTGSKETLSDFNSKLHIGNLLENFGAACAHIVFPKKSLDYSFGNNCKDSGIFKKHASQAYLKEKKSHYFTRSGWGVFWRHKQEMVMASPLYANAALSGGVSIVLPLGKTFHQIRNAQQMILLYIIINGLILTVAGVYQISKTAVKPIHRILKRAEEYRCDNGELIFDERSGNEFRKLTNALNTMMGRISDDRNKLEQTVLSLEQANSELRQAQKDIVRAEKLASVGRLSSGIAHEIGNPLGIVSGYLELIKPVDIDKDQKQDFILRAEKEIERIDGIIRQLLDYSRRSVKEVCDVSVHEVLQEMTEMLSVQPLMNGIEVKLSLSEGGDKVKGDSGQLKQVFLNLSMNAADAIALADRKRNGELDISTELIEHGSSGIDIENFIKITFRDNGIGIPNDMLGNVFDPFFTTKEPGKGTGLGLSVCFMLIEDMGGKISVDSEEGKGTSVNLFLPLMEKKQNHKKPNA